MRIISWKLRVEAEYEEYRQGNDLVRTDYNVTATGVGDTPREALEDALEGLAQSDINVSIDQETDILAELGEPNALINIPFRNACKTDDCPVCTGSWHWYVAVDVHTHKA